MVRNIRKRDGRIENFDREKIAKAILKAMNQEMVNDVNFANQIAQHIEELEKDTVDVEEIQDAVEDELMNSQYKKIAKM